MSDRASGTAPGIKWAGWWADARPTRVSPSDYRTTSDPACGSVGLVRSTRSQLGEDHGGRAPHPLPAQLVVRHVELPVLSPRCTLAWTRPEKIGEWDLEDPPDFAHLRSECRAPVGGPNYRMEGEIADRDVQRGQDAEDPHLVGVDPNLLRSLAERGLRDRLVALDPAARERHLSGM